MIETNYRVSVGRSKRMYLSTRMRCKLVCGRIEWPIRALESRRRFSRWSRGTYHFVKNGSIVVHVLDGDFERAHVVELRPSVVGRKDGQVGFLFSSRFIPVQHLRRPDQPGSVVDLEF